MKSLKILYIHPQEPHNTYDFLSCLLRISNYLNSRKKELNGTIQEEYLDLRFESLPEYIPKKIEQYRRNVTKLLEETQKRFNFNIVAISCYSQFKYCNTVEITSIIKRSINPDCIIVVGGPHPTILPRDFQPGNLPDYIEKKYGKMNSPFDFIIRNEGEIPFYRLIKAIFNDTINPRKELTDQALIVKSETIEDLDEVPTIDFRLYKKYRDEITKFGQINIDFARGCPFSCKICTNSTDLMPCYKKVRIKSVSKCMEELRVIRDTEWLKFNTLYINDMIFLPRRSYRERFFREFKKFKNHKWGFNHPIMINERVELCSESDLKKYKELNIIPQIGFESGSKTMLKRMGKIKVKNEYGGEKNIESYLSKVENIIQIANEIDLVVLLNYIVSPPGSDQNTIKENEDFFLKRRFDGYSLIEKFNVNLCFSKYSALFGSRIYDEIEEKYNGIIYFKEWWKIFHEDQRILSALVEPSDTISLLESINRNRNFINSLFKEQLSRKNNFYHPAKLLRLNHENKKMIRLLGDIKRRNICLS